MRRSSVLYAKVVVGFVLATLCVNLMIVGVKERETKGQNELARERLAEERMKREEEAEERRRVKREEEEEERRQEEARRKEAAEREEQRKFRERKEREVKERLEKETREREEREKREREERERVEREEREERERKERETATPTPEPTPVPCPGYKSTLSVVHGYTEERETSAAKLSGVAGWKALEWEAQEECRWRVKAVGNVELWMEGNSVNRTKEMHGKGTLVEVNGVLGRVELASRVPTAAEIRTGDDLTGYVHVWANCTCAAYRVVTVVTRRPMDEWPAPQEKELGAGERRLLEMRGWRTAPALPFGRQDMGFAVVDEQVLFIFAGFCGGRHEVGDYGCEPRGHSRASEVLNVRYPHWGWREVPPFPGAMRQSASCAALGRSVYCMGGSSYTPIDPSEFVGKALPKYKANPYAYSDLWELKLPEALFADVNVTLRVVNESHWVSSHWEEGWVQRSNAPVDLNGAAMIGHKGKLLLVGGCDYDMLTFHTWSDANGHTYRLGSRLWLYDREQDRWAQGPECPGTPRFDHTLSVVGEYMYVMAGVTTTNSVLQEGGDAVIRATVDNWRYHVEEERWERVADHPTCNRLGRGIQNVVYGRYMVFLGGAPRPVIFPDGRSKEMYGRVQTQESGDWRGYHFSNEVSWYDTELDVWGKCTVRLPFDSVNLVPMVVGKSVYMLGGENVPSCWNGLGIGVHSHEVVVADVEIARVVVSEEG